MSKIKGEQELNKYVNQVLKKSQVFKRLQKNYRDTLNTKYHILDLSFDALRSANVKDNSQEELEVFSDCYYEFIVTLSGYITARGLNTYKSLSSITIDRKKTKKLNTFLIEEPTVLVSPSFGTARDYVSAVSKLIPNNKYFGISNRARTLEEVLREERKTIEQLKAEGRFFDPKSGIEYEDEALTIQRVRALSNVDLGHTPGNEIGRDSPLKSQIEGALGAKLTPAAFKVINKATEIPQTLLFEADAKISEAITKSLQDLVNIQANCVVEFENQLPKQFSQKFGKAGFLSLTLQLFTVNNDLSKSESDVRNALLGEIKEALRNVIKNIPGSNTLEQDLQQGTAILIRNAIMDGITGKGSTAKLKPHDKLQAKTLEKGVQAKKPASEKGRFKLHGSKTPKGGSGTTLKQLEPNLSSLQRLLDANLVQQIKQNMGNGTSTTVLNLRSGRFAESVKVERLSESRQGMITAFYTYMKNPYATFAEGGRQQSPASRNPKLLISKSIREIVQQQVANRLRAVSI
jgi:hypothetical protein